MLSLLAVAGRPLAGQGVQAADSVCSTGRISEIRIISQDVFDLSGTDNALLKAFLGAMNTVHVTTRPSFIRSELLFKEGDCLDPFRLQESERLLRDNRFIGPASVTAEDKPDGTKRVIVETRDEWSTQVDLGVSYDQRVNVETLELTEENFLGRALYLSGEYQSYRERRDISLRLLTPRFFGRADANVEYGSSRAGRFGTQYLTYPFVGEVGTFAGREFYQRRTAYFRYATDGAEAFTHILLPVVEERLEFSGARRFGGPGRYVMLGGSLTRDFYDFEPRELAFNGNYDGAIPAVGTIGDAVLPQVKPIGATRASLHVESHRVSYREYPGLDALKGVTDVELGADAGLTVGHSIPVLEPTGQPAANDWFGRARFRSGTPFGGSILLSYFALESRYEAGTWRDVLGEADLFSYLRAPWLPYQTFFARASYSGGWETGIPFQLALGGRDGVRGLRDDRFPGGQMLIFSLEDRIFHGWPHWRAADLGLTLFTDVGRTWAGDVPYGKDSPWELSLGAGLRLGFPSGTRNVIRFDFSYPVGSDGSGLVFRATVFERLGLRHGFSEDLFRRSRRLDLGLFN